ncbi:unnamed protein product [Didymodactylos carnosus]|uniref:Uncharacterized protein n=1 Tax=Didymodactylos carnosus TaxID=1234261 RepID=A0A8S2Y6B8_9BILA|nr:unnamed protein product [Didymodactylos carnosus]
MNSQYPLIIGSDTASKITKAVSKAFLPTTHLFCTRHERQNIERQLTKTRVHQDDRQKLLEAIIDVPDLLIKSENTEAFEDRLAEFEHLWNEIKNVNPIIIIMSWIFMIVLLRIKHKIFKNISLMIFEMLLVM